MGKTWRMLGVLAAALIVTLTSAHSQAAAPADLDPSFGSGGKVTTDFNNGSVDVGAALAIQPDGRIVVAGDSVTATGNGDFALARYNLDGSLDATFGSGGKVTTDFGADSDNNASAVAIQADGKVVAAGESQQGRGPRTFALARYNANGTLDVTFGSGGKVTTSFGSPDDRARTLAIQPDGRIVVAGSFATGPRSDVALARYNTNGSLDTSFGSGGKVITDFGGVDDASAVALQPDGKILVTGSSSTGFVARYDPNGRLDATFGTGGKATIPIGSVGLALQVDGKIVIAGSAVAPGGPVSFAVARLNADGSLDVTFGSGGTTITSFGGSTSVADALVLQPDGKIVVAGRDFGAGFALARYTPDGVLDPTFGGGGKTTTDFGSGGNSDAAAVRLQADGKIVAAGFSGLAPRSDFALARYQGDAIVLELQVNSSLFGVGDTFRSDVAVESPGPQTTVDVFFGAVLPPAAGPGLGCPGGDAIALLADAFAHAAVTCLSASPQSFVPLFRNVSLPAGLPRTIVPDFFVFVWPSTALRGRYVFAIALVRSGTLEVLAVATRKVNLQ